MATSRVALGSVLSTVTNAAAAVSSIFDTITDGVGMAQEFTKNASIKQKTRHIAEYSSFKTALVEEIAEIDTERQMRLVELRAKSEDHAKAYDANEERLNKALEEAENK